MRVSWDATLWAGREECRCLEEPCPHKAVYEWNYTHNCNRMANTAVDDEGEAWGNFLSPPDGSWWRKLSGMSGPEGAAFLDRIIRRLEADPDRFRALDPPNGWGDYESFLKVLTEMRNSVPEWPTTWSVHG